LTKITLGLVAHTPGASKRNKTGGWRTLRPVVDETKCKKCWLCVVYCPDSAMKKGQTSSLPDYDYCKGCGICAKECPSKCITMVEEAR